MRWGWSAALAAAALWLSCATAGAGNDEDATVMLFSGRDLWANGFFLYGGFLIAPGGFEQDGFMLKLVYSAGVYRYNAGSLGGERVDGLETQAQVLPGFRIKRGNAEFKFFFGPEWQRHRLSPADPGNALSGQSFGMRFATELWEEPTGTTLVTGNASVSSIVSSHDARLAYGWRVADDIFNGEGFYLGPEVQYLGAEGYRQWRFGAHITSMKSETTEWSASGGFARDSDGRSSPYVRLGISSRM